MSDIGGDIVKENYFLLANQYSFSLNIESFNTSSTFISSLQLYSSVTVEKCKIGNTFLQQLRVKVRNHYVTTKMSVVFSIILLFTKPKNGQSSTEICILNSYALDQTFWSKYSNNKYAICRLGTIFAQKLQWLGL